jgi:hypothetical protein
MRRSHLRAVILCALVVMPAVTEAQTPLINQGVPQRLSALEATVAALRQVVDAQSAELEDLRGLVAGFDSRLKKLSGSVGTLQTAEVQKLNQYLSVLSDENGQPLIVFREVNVQIVSGLGAAGGCWPHDAPTNGLGNLIVGYNEPRGENCGLIPAVRTGSHNVVIGSGHSYTGQGGFVAGQLNTIASTGTSVCGGLLNTANELWASVSGGQYNRASANFSNISGGVGNLIDGTRNENGVAAGYASWIGGGGGNSAKAPFSSIVGGQNNTTNGYGGVISAGSLNSTNGNLSWVGGGWRNKALGDFSSVTGGDGNVANGLYEVIP